MNERLIKDVDELSALYTADRSARISIVDKINELLPRIQAAILAASDFAEVQSAQRALRICTSVRLNFDRHDRGVGFIMRELFFIFFFS